MKYKNIEPELSRLLAVDKIPSHGMEEKMVASPAERKALAERFGLLDLPLLTANLHIGPASKLAGVTVKGTLIADVVQQCTVTLEPLPSHIEEKFEVHYAAYIPEDKPDSTSLLETDQDDIEPITDGVIDLGETVAQYLGATLDPYPRKPGVAFVDVAYGDVDAPPNPFAKLVNLPKNPKD